MDKVIMWHHPNCTFNSTDTPDGDFCNCRGVVDKRDYDALARQVATLERVSQEDHCRAEQLEHQLAEARLDVVQKQWIVLKADYDALEARLATYEEKYGSITDKGV